jgi:hypothetical protein
MLSRLAILCTVLLLPLASIHAAEAPPGELALTGKVVHPQQFDLAKLRALPSQDVQVSFDTEPGAERAGFTGVALWALLGEVGGIDDKAKGAVLRHTIKVTGRDGYFVVLSTGEIAPDFGAKAALIAYQRAGEAAGASGFRLVMPGDKRGGRNVRDVVTIDVE